MKSKFIQFLFFFFGILLVMQIFGVGKKTKVKTDSVKNDVEIILNKDNIKSGDIVFITLKNNLKHSLKLEKCLEKELILSKYRNGIWSNLKTKGKIPDCKNTEIKSKGKKTVSFGKYNYELFSKIGRYKIILPIEISGKEKIFSREFNIVPPSLTSQLWSSLFYKPIYNILILFIQIIPGHSLGAAIILLTLLIRIILFPLQQKALRSQKELQHVQPILNQIKEKYKNNKERQAQETMKIWKEHKINPFGSCLPTLIQFPVMIALFFVVKNGINIEANTHLLYSFIKDGDTIINPIFFGIMNLTEKNVFILPLIIGGLQFLQMKLSFALKSNAAKKKNKKIPEIDQTQAMNATMTYILPIMIAFFTASLPSGVGLYWGTTTIFGIGQQLFINKKHG